MKRLLTLAVVLCMAGSAFGAVKFNTTMGLNNFLDSRITGMSQGMGFTYMVDDYEAGWQWDNAALTATDSTNAGVHALTQAITAMRIGKVLTPNVVAGIEIGQLTITDLVGTLTQTQPIGGLYGKLCYESKVKDVSTAISTMLGIRSGSFTAANPAGGWADTNITSFNSWYLEIAATIGF